VWGLAERETARVILDRIAADARARAFREVRVQLPRCDEALLAAANTRFGVVAPFGVPAAGSGLTLHCPADRVFELAGFLRDQGALVITVTELEYVFSGDNALAAQLEALVG